MDTSLYRHKSMHLYKPINAYGAIGDCQSIVLVAPNGSIDWGCLPDFDSPAIFCRLLDEQQGGYFQIAPASGTVPGTQRYLPGSNVLQTCFTSTAGAITLTDFLPVESVSAWPLRAKGQKASTSQNSLDQCLVRIVECIHGELPIMVRLKVTPNYASSSSEVSLFPNRGVLVSSIDQHTGLAIFDERGISDLPMTLEQEPGEIHPTVVLQTTLREGERLLFALGIESTAAAARSLIETVLPQRDFTTELAQTL
ncbi:MAG TPA: trehalase-like domain-containing protein, partial [Ktedonobacteraceae bacterium]|nr:trehalase-like domain-containing protein [Ktedonobacteraceae bacterium]